MAPPAPAPPATATFKSPPAYPFPLLSNITLQLAATRNEEVALELRHG
jgi:hypothetical protein